MLGVGIIFPPKKKYSPPCIIKIRKKKYLKVNWEAEEHIINIEDEKMRFDTKSELIQSDSARTKKGKIIIHAHERHEPQFTKKIKSKRIIKKLKELNANR